MHPDKKMAALKIMIDGGEDKEEYMKPHKAKCPNCGHEWMMGAEEEENEDEEMEDEDY